MKLKRWQIEGAAWLATRRHALLADEMRVGKTLAAIRGCDHIGAKRILVVCPAVGRHNWGKQFLAAQTTHRPVHLVLTRAALPAPETRPSVVITSYDLARADGFPGDWDVMIADEAHYLRNCPTARSQEILGKGGLVHQAARAWLLTGTPAVNNASELWVMLHVFGLYLGSYEEFVREYCTGYRGPYGFRVTGNKNVHQLRGLLSGFMLRRKFRDIAPDLPPLDFSDYVLEGVYPPGVPPMEIDVHKALVTADPIAALEALASSVTTLRRYMGVAKVGATVDLVTAELSVGRGKLVLFAVHHEVIEMLIKQLAPFQPAVVYGKSAPSARHKAVQRFQEDPACRVFIGNIVAAGTALDLSAADDALFVEYSWVPGDNAQAAMRIQNMNAITPKTVRFLSLAGSIDEDVARVYRRKARDMANIFD